MEEMPPPPPAASTYRIQASGQRLADLTGAIAYLDALGVGALYLSPVAQAQPGSTHGYDVIDPARVDPALGDEADVAALAAELARHRMGLLLDVVPNHMAASPRSPWFAEVLARGEASPHAAAFDIDWARGGGRLHLPVLGTTYGEALARGELTVGPDGVRYFDHRFPLAAGTAPEPGRALDADATHAVLERQHYRLADWRTAPERANARRFFDVNDLIGLRVEDPAVFDRVLALPLRLARAGHVTGLRVDHVDGLRDPRGALERMQRALVGDDAYARGERFWVVVEKILSAEEQEDLPDDWPVHGTTGYEFGRAVTSVLVDAGGLERLGELYHRLAGRPPRFGDLLLRDKRRMLLDLFPGDLARCTELLCALADGDRDTRDLSPRALGEALAALTAALPVYRTYAHGGVMSAVDRARVAGAAELVRASRPDVVPAALEMVRRALSCEVPGGEELLARWQQLTGPVMAKGLEDTALYQYNRLVALNMVGGEPDPPRQHLTAAAFHRYAAHQAERWPGGLLATSTHDSKRSEDVRCRLHVLSEIPEAWQRALTAWTRMNAQHRIAVGPSRAPDANEELFLYQTMVGAWPFDTGDEAAFGARLRRYLVKALREAKVHTSWHQPDEVYEAAVLGFAGTILDPARSAEFLDGMRRFAARVALSGAVGSLSQLALKLASPGVADFYQGTELWTLTLVDPDNRAPVDLELRARLLAEVNEAFARDPVALCRDLVRRWSDGRIKLHVTARGLAARRADPALFLGGAYLPAEVTGARAAHLLSFARRADDRWLLCATPRHPARLATGMPLGVRVWRDTAVRLPDGAPRRWRDLATGQVVKGEDGSLAACELFRHLPVALLRGEPNFSD